MADQKKVPTLYCQHCQQRSQYYGPTSENYCECCGTQNAIIQHYQNALHKQKQTEIDNYKEDCAEDLDNFDEIGSRINIYYNERRHILNQIESLHLKLATLKCEIDEDFKEEKRFHRYQQNRLFKHSERIKDMERTTQNTIYNKLKIEWRMPSKIIKPVMNTPVIINPNFTGMFVISFVY